MEAEEAGRLSQNTAERMRIIAESAREIAQRAVEAESQKREEAITATVHAQREIVDAAITKTAEMGRNSVNHKYSERISASRNSREEIAAIEDFANIVTERLQAGLQKDGFDVHTRSEEVIDFRESESFNSPPEYYDTTITIQW